MKIKRVIISLFLCTTAVVFTASCSCAGNNESNNTATTAESETVDSEKDTVSGESAENNLGLDTTKSKTASLVSHNSSSSSSASSGAKSSAVNGKNSSTKSSKVSKSSSNTSAKTSSKTQSKNSSKTTSDTTSEGIPKDNVEIDFGDLE